MWQLKASASYADFQQGQHVKFRGGKLTIIISDVIQKSMPKNI